MNKELSAEWIMQGNLYALEGAICDTEFMQNGDVNMEIRYITKSDDRRAVSKVYEESWNMPIRGLYRRITLTVFRRGSGCRI